MSWKCTYKGRPDRHSASGHAQPSWHTFDCRTWEKGQWRIDLTNLTNSDKLRGHKAVVAGVTYIREGTLYQATVVAPKVLMQFQGTDWVALIKQAKAYADDPETWLDDKILLALELFPTFGVALADITAAVFGAIFRESRNHTTSVRIRLMWLAEHGFVFARGNPGKGTRWCIEIGQEARFGDRDRL